MKHRFHMSTIVIIALSVLLCSTANHASAEKWSLKKINPFGKQEGRTSTRSTTSSRWAPKVDAQKMVRPVTPDGIKESLSKLRQGTSSAIAQTKQALTPPKINWPQLRLPKFGSDQPRVARSAKKTESVGSKTHSLVSWIFPEKNQKK